MRFTAHTTSLPVETNGVWLDPDHKDRWGRVLRLTRADHPEDVCDGSGLVTSSRGHADDDHPGARLPRGRPHRALRAVVRDLTGRA